DGEDHVASRRPRERRRDDLVVPPDPRGEQRQVKARGRRADGDRVLRAYRFGKEPLELRDARTARDPAGAKTRHDGIDLGVTDRRAGEWQKLPAARSLG